MAGKTNSEGIQEISETITKHIPATEVQFEGLRREINALARSLEKIDSSLQAALQRIAALDQRITQLENIAQDASPSRLSVVEEKCKQLEKLSDRRWQVWLVFFGCLATLIAQLIVSFAKK